MKISLETDETGWDLLFWGGKVGLCGVGEARMRMGECTKSIFNLLNLKF